MAFLAVDLGGSPISWGLVENSELVACEDFDVPSSERLGPVLPLLRGHLSKLIEGYRGPIQGIGIGFCGVVDEDHNSVASTNGTNTPAQPNCAHTVLCDSGLSDRFEVFHNTHFDHGLIQQVFSTRDFTGTSLEPSSDLSVRMEH